MSPKGQVNDLLNQVMSPDSLVWISQDMPTVNPFF
jgi:hypothetical protein